MNDMDRIRTGIKGLDEAVQGLPISRTVLVTGDAGSGKTIFGLQLANECCKNGLRTVFLSTEEEAEDLLAQGESFSWDLRTFEKKKALRFIEMVGPRLLEIESAMSISVRSQKGNFESLLEHVPDDTEVLILDSLGSHTSDLKPTEFKDRLDLMVYRLNKRKISTLLILDSATSKEYNELAMFSVYGAIVLTKRENPYTGRRERVMDIVKMRNTMTPIQLLTFSIRSDGISITSSEECGDAT
jgi:KaiC/GvpD/RAD55 family RecA-like ATPase